jgi:hypothetical protein
MNQGLAEMQGLFLCRVGARPIPGVNAFSAPAFGHEGQTSIVIATERLSHSNRWRTDKGQR